MFGELLPGLGSEALHLPPGVGGEGSAVLGQPQADGGWGFVHVNTWK